MTKIAVIGMGPIGMACARAVRANRNLALVGLVDVDPEKVGTPADELLACDETGGEQLGAGEVGEPNDLRVTDNLEQGLPSPPDVAVLCTGSTVDGIEPTLTELINHGIAVVSSCEQLLWPWLRHEKLAEQLDHAAREAGVSVLGTGVNPGFVMDTLAVFLASMVREVTKVRCVRRVDAALRRQPLQRKVGARMTEAHFNALAKEGKIGHAGLAESLALLAAGLGEHLQFDAINETLEPVLAEKATPSALGLIEPGQVCGMRNRGKARSGNLKIDLDLTMAVGLEDPMDRIELDGPVPLKLNIPGSTPGDSATVAALINQATNLHRVQPGIRTMLDMPPPRK